MVITAADSVTIRKDTMINNFYFGEKHPEKETEATKRTITPDKLSP